MEEKYHTGKCRQPFLSGEKNSKATDLDFFSYNLTTFTCIFLYVVSQPWDQTEAHFCRDICWKVSSFDSLSLGRYQPRLSTLKKNNFRNLKVMCSVPQT